MQNSELRHIGVIPMKHIHPFFHQACSKCMAACLSLLLLSMTGCSGCRRKSEPPQVPESTREANDKTSGAEVSKSGKDGSITTESAQQEQSSADRRKADTANQTSQAAAADGSSIGSQGSLSSDSRGGTASESGGGLSAKEAQERARESQRTAERLASKGEVSKAFQELLTAWQGLQLHPDDPSSRALANELKMTLKEYGELLNELAAKNDGASISRKPLTVE